jgi:hypothetical protein
VYTPKSHPLRGEEDTLSAKTLQAAFTAPFDDDQIGKVEKRGKRFSNVSPIHYVDRLVENHPLGYDVDEGPHTILNNSVLVPVGVTLYLDGATRHSSATGTSPLIDPDGQTLDAGDAVKSAASDGLKRALMKWGLGSHLYHEEAEKVAFTTKPSASKTARIEVDEEEDETPPPAREKAKPNTQGDWAGKREKFTVPIGKHKGEAYSEIEASWLSWYQDKVEKSDKNARVYDCVHAEIKYRKDNGEWTETKKFGSKAPAKKRSIADSDETDF